MAHTTTDIAMITVLSTSIHRRFSFENSKVNGIHFGSSSQLMMFWQPQVSMPVISRATLTQREKKVRTAQPIPTLPIFVAMVSSFFWKSLSIKDVYIPAQYFRICEGQWNIFMQFVWIVNRLNCKRRIMQSELHFRD